ncbi:MAG: hypothetical protein IV100_10910 [Myxococcales bacterium]|nr:hypothetical protein [Myxococcales bacterium]
MSAKHRNTLPPYRAVLAGVAAAFLNAATASADGPLNNTLVLPNHEALPAMNHGAQTAVWGLQLRIGDTRVYRIQSNGSVDVDYGVIAATLSNGLGGTPAGTADASRRVAAQYEIQGDLHYRVVGKDNGGFLLAARLQNALVHVDGVVDPRRDLLEQPFLIRVAPSGALRSFEFVRGFPADLGRVIRGVVEPLQLVFPKAASGSWVAQENAVGGAYDARYSGAMGGANPAQLQKTKTRIYGVPMADAKGLPAGAATRIGKANATITLDPTAGTVETITASEDTTTDANGAFISSHVGDYSAERVKMAIAALPTTAQDAARALEGDDVARARLYEVNPRIAPRVAGLTVEGMLAVFDAELAKNQASAHLLLKSWLRLNPTKSLAMARELEARPGGGESAAAVVGFAALSAAGHPEAQAALIEILGGAKTTATMQERALMAILDVAMPEPALLKAVWSFRSTIVADDAAASVMQSLATNVYGALGDAQRGNASVTQEVLHRLSSLLASATDSRQAVLALDALTNVGDYALVAPIVRSSLSSKDAAVRTAAFVTFRRMTGEAAFTEFGQRFAAEVDPAVRREAARVALEMPESAARTAWAKAQLTGAAETDVLVTAVRILGRELGAQPENALALRALLDVSRDRQVRREVYAFVAPRSEGGQ